jgi:predicted class III extradiol MEMO1 family dioxygenase
MPTRPPAVAGQFYEGTPDRLRAQVNACFAANEAAKEKRRFIGAVVPHAGLMYSGHVAAAFYALGEMPKRFVILCPNHTGAGHFAAINREGSWRTPLGDATIDTPLADALMSRASILADVARDEAIGILASSDLNHYEDQQETLRKDQIAIDAVLALDPKELWRVVGEYDISMCGFIPTTAMLIAAKQLGATRAELIKHATSGDINRDYSHVVGYASILIS